MKNTSLFRLLLVGFVTAATQAALCQGTVYTSRSAFEGVLSTSISVPFEDVPSTPYGMLGGEPVVSSGITVTAPYLVVTDPTGGFYPIPGTGKYLWVFDGTHPMTILLPDGITAFGADFACERWWLPSYTATLTVKLVSGDSQTFNFTESTDVWTFFGVTFPEPVASVIFADNPTQWLHEEMLDNVTYGTVIPEPNSAVLLALATAALLRWRQKRRHEI